MITTATLRDWLGVDSDQDVILAGLIAQATAHLSHALNRHLGPVASVVETRAGGTGYGYPYLYLEQTPATATLLSVYTRGGPGDAWVLLPSDRYEFDGERVDAFDSFPPGRSTVQFRYQAGYLTDEAPLELQALVRDMAALKYGQRGQAGQALGMQSETIGSYSYTRADEAILAGWDTVVNHWRRRPV